MGNHKSSAEKCLFCKSIQNIICCSSYTTEPVSQRFDLIKSVPACINCHKRQHTIAKRTSSKCRIFGSSHNCINTTQAEVIGTLKKPSTSHWSVNYSATATVSKKSCSGKLEPDRALFDSSSQPILITEEFAQLFRFHLFCVLSSTTNFQPYTTVFHLSTSIENESNIDSIFWKFWELQEVPNKSIKI